MRLSPHSTLTPRRGKPKITGPDPIDVHVGTRLRLARTLRGLSQEKLGDGIGLTFQQVQKYERGVNRIAPSRLYKVAQLLDFPISFFFDDMGGAKPSAEPDRAALEAQRSFALVPAAQRGPLLSLMRSLAGETA